MRKTLTFIFSFFAFIAASFAKNAPDALKPGLWQGVLQRPDGEQIIFNFEAQRQNGKQVWYVINAGERLLVNEISQKGDSVWVTMPFFASSFALAIKPNGKLEGNYIKNYGDKNQTIPFYAIYGVEQRYPIGKPKYDVSGKWSVLFGSGNDTLAAVGEFQQDDHGKVTGTFLTPTGDYRYLEGSITGDSLKISAFDGGHAILFSARLSDAFTVYDGKMYSGLNSTSAWKAVKNDKASLPDGYSLTKMRPGETKLNFRFLSTEGRPVSIKDTKYKGKVVLVQILGSWCPNCMDETAFLSEYYNKYHNRGFEIIGLAYERTTDFNVSKKSLAPFRKRFNVNYPFLITGVTVSDEHRTEKTLPQLQNINAFPTTIFIGKDGMVKKIRQGYDGPATGQHYEDFKKEFDELMTGLLEEK